MKRRLAVVLFAFALGAGAIGLGRGGGGLRSVQAAPAPFTTPIEHVVIIYQENHSFDETLGQVCLQYRPTDCDATRTGKIHTGATVSLTRSPDIVPAASHNTKSQAKAIAGGAMNGFDTIPGCNDGARSCYSQYYPDQIPNLAALARQFVVSDRTFAQDSVPSWGGHLNLAAATLDGFVGDNPGADGPGWGCDSGNMAKWRATPSDALQSVPSCVPNQQGRGRNGSPSPVSWVPTIMDRLDTAGRSWSLYVSPKSKKGYSWSICPTFADCIYTSQASHMKVPATITDDARNGALPNFAIVTPTGPTGETSQHNGTSMIKGDNWIGQIVTAIENGPQWSSTAIFITYDDCGCFYDHVPPPPGLGIRLPMVIVSPYAKPGFTDHGVASTASMLAFAEHVLGLTALNARDGGAYDYLGSFDFPPPSTAAVQMTQTAVPPDSQQYMDTHPSTDMDDDT